MFITALVIGILVCALHCFYCTYYCQHQPQQFLVNLVTLFGVISMLVTIWFGLLGIGASFSSTEEAGILKQSVRNLEEVVRFRLDSIPAILGPAVYLMEQSKYSDGDIFFMTFTPKLGAAHLDPFKASPAK
ncbi:MAG: hypothetical protein B7Z37_10605, partial [Verrucomicrobia bacterium 12-59-8]